MSSVLPPVKMSWAAAAKLTPVPMASIVSSAPKDTTLEQKPTKYIPPSQRKSAEETVKETGVVDITNTSLFPSLGGPKLAPVKTSVWNKPNAETFKDKIETLIELEKQTEAEKEHWLEAQKALEGFVKLKLPSKQNRQWFMNFNEREYEHTVVIDSLQRNIEAGVVSDAQRTYYLHPNSPLVELPYTVEDEENDNEPSYEDDYENYSSE